MNAPHDLPPALFLGPEWERLHLLGYFALLSRQGQALADDSVAQLRELQAQVDALRAPGGVWQRALGCMPDTLALDVLACVAAPELEPRVGWVFQQLHGGSSPYASRALIQELLALDATQAHALRGALDRDAPLAHSGWLRCAHDDPYKPLQADARLLARLGGHAPKPAPPPGAEPVPLLADWQDLVLPADRLQLLREFLLWIRERDTVVGRWGGQRVGGPVALFAGPSGTGKTLAASVIASALGWPLFRIDLGRLVSKYVGETEENLNRLFEAAHDRPMVLQFDEADALFAKRGEVKEARDRYANMEVSHLLTRIESHDGPCILTTNLRRQLDAAFLRRIHIVVEFPRPDAAGRSALWKRLLPPRAPRAGDLDTELLAAAVPLTGGQIRNAALHAAYLAAGEGGAPIGLCQVAVGVWRELSKDGRENSRTDIGALAEHLPEELIRG
ncbi:ATP-binding protein [Variovorax saccharolyticus]|uniref:ATP-binding protein n=1 Tax=Variovorax saccharolyticus TaxID=3053516 RepID=UPI002577E92B|nr:ATP-binding protein [Variovorax sp. J31P216]MDM0030048.1 ATP-binding protein [Variovorax sp. J31P216]